MIFTELPRSSTPPVGPFTGRSLRPSCLGADCKKNQLPWALEVSRAEEGERRCHLDAKGQPNTGNVLIQSADSLDNIFKKGVGRFPAPPSAHRRDESRPFAQLLLRLVWYSGRRPAPTLALPLGHVVRIPNLTEVNPYLTPFWFLRTQGTYSHLSPGTTKKARSPTRVSMALKKTQPEWIYRTSLLMGALPV